jgi:hypothetical protein
MGRPGRVPYAVVLICHDPSQASVEASRVFVHACCQITDVIPALLEGHEIELLGPDSVEFRPLEWR